MKKAIATEDEGAISSSEGEDEIDPDEDEEVEKLLKDKGTSAKAYAHFASVAPRALNVIFYSNSAQIALSKIGEVDIEGGWKAGQPYGYP